LQLFGSFIGSFGEDKVILGQPAGVVEAREQIQQRGRRVRVEVPRRLVGEDERRVVHERAYDREPLLLAAGERVRQPPRPRRSGHG